MVLPVVTAAVALFYLSAVPIHIALRLTTQDGLGFGISAFEPRFALRQARAPQKPRKMKRPKISLREILDMLSHVKIESIHVRGVFGSDDAALTALACGGISALGCALRGILGRRVRVSVQPDFSANALRVELSGMISIRAGHIMLAALHGATLLSSRRLKQWTSIPSKAS